MLVSVTELRSWPTRPAEWKVEPDVSSARSTRTMSVQPRSARWYAIDVPPTPPPMITARAWSAIGAAYRSFRRVAGSWRAPAPRSLTPRLRPWPHDVRAAAPRPVQVAHAPRRARDAMPADQWHGVVPLSLTCPPLTGRNSQL